MSLGAEKNVLGGSLKVEIVPLGGLTDTDVSIGNGCFRGCHDIEEVKGS